MVDPVLTSVATAVLAQGVTFLYQQAGELLQRRRAINADELGAGEDPDPAGSGTNERQALQVPTPPAEVFPAVASMAARPVALDRIDQAASDLLRARRGVEAYVLGDAPLDARSSEVVQAVDDLRRLLEQVHDADLTFAGERREGQRSAATTSIKGQRGGVNAGGSITARDIAGRDFHVTYRE